MARFRLAKPLSLLLLGSILSGNAIAAPTVGVGSSVNCPGAYLSTGNSKVCKAEPDFKDILYLGENSRRTCSLPYTRVNAGSSKWCVKYAE